MAEKKSSKDTSKEAEAKPDTTKEVKTDKVKSDTPEESQAAYDTAQKAVAKTQEPVQTPEQPQPKRRFKLKKDASAERQIRKAHYKAYKLQKLKLAQLTTKDREIYEMLNDPNNGVMLQIKYGGDEALQELYKEDL